MDEPDYIFGKTLTQHLEILDHNERYLELRVERFAQEFLDSNEITFDQIDWILQSLSHYLYQCEDSPELGYTLMNLSQASYWLMQYSES